MLAKRGTMVVTGKESCEGGIICSTFPFWLLRVSSLCMGSQERNSMLVLPCSSTAGWKGFAFTVYLLNKSICENADSRVVWK